MDTTVEHYMDYIKIYFQYKHTGDNKSLTLTYEQAAVLGDLLGDAKQKRIELLEKKLAEVQ